MTSSSGRRDGLDVAVVVDATMKSEHFDYVHGFLEAITEPARLAYVAFGDHPECAGNDIDDVDLFDVLVSDFSTDLRAQREHLASHVRPVSMPYCDAALECALAKVTGLDWRDDADKRLFILGWSIPHHSKIAELPIRTGLVCPDGQCWKTQLDRVRSLPSMQVMAARPRAEENAPGSLELLRRAVWKQLSPHARPDVLDSGLAQRWERHWSR